MNVYWETHGIDPGSSNLVFSIILVLLLFFPLLLLLWTKRSMGKLKRMPSVVLEPSNSPTEADDLLENDENSIKKILCSIEFWLLFFVFFGAVGPANMVNVQMNQMNVALGGSTIEIKLSVMIFALAGSMSRLLIGKQATLIARCG